MKNSYTQHLLTKNSNANYKLNAHQSQLVKSHFYLVDILANIFLKEYPNLTFLTKSDLVSASDEGLIEAACHYDSERNASFKTYASKCIWHAMMAEIQRWHPTHTIVELEVVNGEFVFVKKKTNLFTHVDDSGCYPTPSVCCDWQAEEDCLYETLDEALAHLENKESRLIRARFGYDGKEMKLREMADEYGVSTQAVQKRCNNTVSKLRTFFEDANSPYPMCA